MNSLTVDRERILNLVQRDKTRIGISLAEVMHLDRRLTDQWGICFIDTQKSIDDLLAQISDKAAAERYIEVSNGASLALASRVPRSTLQIERALFDTIAHPELLALITSKRRHLVLDGCAVALGLVKTLELKGEILDVGCHAGFVGSLLAEELGRSTTGIDPSSAAIALGRSHPARSPRLNLIEGAIPWETEARFDLAVVIDAMPQERNKVGPYLRGLSNILNPAGIALISSSYWVDADTEVTRRQLRNANLGFGYADVVGGYGNIPPQFEATGYLVLVKGGTGILPRNLRALMESEWHHFKEYANAPGTADNEKTQSYERSKRGSGP